MNAVDAERLVYKVFERVSLDWELEKDPKFCGEREWSLMMDICATMLRYHVKYHLWFTEVPGTMLTVADGKFTKVVETPTPLHWTAARLIFYIEQIKGLLGPAIGVVGNATLELVWNVGMFFLDLALDGLKKKMGAYSYAPPPQESLTLL